MDKEGFDLVWLPSIFIPGSILDVGLANLHRSTRSEGRVVIGAADVSGNDLAAAVDALMTIRSGGSLLTPDEAIERLKRAGFAQAHEVERTWGAPLRLIVGEP